MSYSPINIIYAIHEKSSSIHLPHFIFRLFIPKVRIHIHCRRHFRMPHQILQRLRIHPSPSHISTISMPAHMGVIPGNCTVCVRLYFPTICLKYFSQCPATFGIPFLSRNKNPILLPIIGSTFGRLRVFNIRRKHSYTSCVIGRSLTPQPVFVCVTTYCSGKLNL